MNPMALRSQTCFTVVLWIWMNQAIIESHAAWFRWGNRPNVYYFPRNDERKYENAQIECQRRGANLVSVSGVNKNQFLDNHFVVSESHWIGLHCKRCVSDAQLQWYGESVSYRNWVNGGVSIGPSETNVFTFIRIDGKWDYTSNANSQRPYICERPDGCSNPSNPCQNGGTCNADDSGGYTCTCTTGYSGINCTINDNDCFANACEHGTCVDGNNTYTCECLDTGYRGQRCDIDINECIEGGHNCVLNHGTCVNNEGGFSCLCDPGYTGSTCWDEIDECQPNPCQNEASCDDHVNAYTCTCTAGFTGPICDIDIDECTTGTHDCDTDHGLCLNSIGSFTCACEPGYTDPICATELDECNSNPCQNGASCEDLVNAYVCECTSEFTGDTCQHDVDECTLDTHNCVNGQCRDAIGSFTCDCPSNFTGTQCETDVDECLWDITCGNGTCVNSYGAYSCQCPDGLEGPLCDEDINECLSETSCDSHGNCTNFDGGYNCTCFEGYNPDDNCASKLDRGGQSTRTPTTEEENLTPYWTALYVAAVLCPLTFTLFMLLLVEDRIYHRRMGKRKRHNALVDQRGDNAAGSDNDRDMDFINLCEQDGSSSKVAALGDPTNEGACAL